MFSKTFLATLALVGAVSAVPTGSTGSTTAGPQCCQNVQNASQLDAKDAGVLAGLLGVVVSGLNVPIGTGCTPIDILGGVQCNTNTVQCGQVFEKSLIGVDCVPVILNLKRNWTPPAGSTPSTQCCQNVKNSNDLGSGLSSVIDGLLGVGVDVSSLNIPIGTGCTPVDILGGVSCNTNTVSCGQVFEESLVGIDCVPVVANVKRGFSPQCCQNVQNSSQLDSKDASVLAGLLGVAVSSLNVPIGTGCTAIDVLSGVSCNENTVQCGTVFESALIAVNCIPIIINA